MEASIALKELKNVLNELNNEGHDVEYVVIDEEFENIEDMKKYFGDYDFENIFKHEQKTTGIYAYCNDPDGYNGYQRYRNKEYVNEYIVKLF